MISNSFGSTASGTEIDIFKSLGNPSIVDTHSGVGVSEQRSQIPYQYPHAHDSHIPSTAAHHVPTPIQFFSQTPSSHPPLSQTPLYETIYNPSRLPTTQNSGSSFTNHRLPFAKPDPKISFHDHPNTSHSGSNATAPGSNHYVYRRKQLGIMELKKMSEVHKMSLTREYTMEDSLDDIWFEVDEQYNLMELKTGTAKMESALKWVLMAVEFGNKKMGNRLNLKNLCVDVSKDIQQFREVFIQLHDRYFRKKSNNPLIQLAWVFTGVVVNQQLKNWVQDNDLNIFSSTMSDNRVSPNPDSSGSSNKPPTSKNDGEYTTSAKRLRVDIDEANMSPKRRKITGRRKLKSLI